ncbi:Ras-related and estrogen-regulated growth inhibitor [Galemys pyrenaicus]|uniref:Ras-related and estrogen-regulated growth inhibitor n=5 Tax=Boreoeutheria TaxID=1437010 RepID=A0A8J6A6J9_GALPY|nr:Ras-related and estrogen-regulated growth inhibitor [Galemys pyrenaicus]
MYTCASVQTYDHSRVKVDVYMCASVQTCDHSRVKVDVYTCASVQTCDHSRVKVSMYTCADVHQGKQTLMSSLEKDPTHLPQEVLAFPGLDFYLDTVSKPPTKEKAMLKSEVAESTYRHQATIDDEVVTMEILDTAGQEDTIQREGHMRWGEGFVLVYDITDRGSFEEVLPLKNILDEIKKPKNVTLILVGNKADLDHSRQVSTEEGEKLATELACAFYECSACTGEGNITEIFYELCREVRRRRMVQGKTRRRSSTTHVKQAINKMLTKISS